MSGRRSCLAAGLLAAGVLAFGVPAAGISEAPRRGLFADVPGRRGASPAGLHAGAGGRAGDIRSRRVRIDRSAISGPDLPSGAASLLLNLFPDVALTAVKQRFERRGSRRSTWVGKVPDDPASSVILVEVEGVVGGSIAAHGRRYAIRGAGGESREIVEIDQGAFPPEACDQPPVADEPRTPSAPAGAPEASADSGSVIDVLVVYTPAALARRGGDPVDMETLSAAAVEETNISYANSGVTTSLNLVHVAQVAYVETMAADGYHTDLTRLRNAGDSHMDDVHTLRDRYAADVVVLLVDAENAYPTICGYAYLEATASTAFALVGENCAVLTYTFGHEIGHLQGARHDRYVDPGSGNNHGHVDLTLRKRTIMAYNTRCLETSPFTSCTRELQWSNPAVAYPGSARPTGTLAYENNALVLNTSAATVANFRQGLVTLTVRSEYPAEGVAVDADPPDANGLGGGTTPFTRIHRRGATVTLTAPALDPLFTAYPLLGWSGCTNVGDPVPDTCAVALEGDATVTARYDTPNRVPTLDAIADLEILEDAGGQTVPLTGISAGEGEGAQEAYLQLRGEIVASDPPGLLQDVAVSHAGGPDASLSFAPAPDLSGAATVRVTLDDQHPLPPALPIYNTVSRELQVRVAPVNDPPAGTVTINGGAAATGSTAVTLRLDARDDGGGPIRMCISGTKLCSSWTEPPPAWPRTRKWTLPGGSGIKTVYARFRDRSGKRSVWVSDTILLDTTRPTDGTGTMAVIPGDAQLTLDWSVTGFRDAHSGIVRYVAVFREGSPPASCGDGTPVPGYDGAATTLIHADLVNGTTFGYRVCAIDAVGRRSFGATATGSPLSP